MVLDKHASENEIKLKELEKKYNKLLANTQESAFTKDEKHYKSMRKKGNQDSKKNISKAKVAYQNKVLVSKSRMIETFNEYLLEEIKSFINSDKYDSYFANCLESAMKNFSGEDKLRIIIRKVDKKYLDNKDMDIEISDELLGGFHIIANENIKYDYSIEGKLSDASEYIGCLILKLMTNKAGENNERK